MSSAAFALGIPAMARSAQSRIWDGRSNSRPIRDRANVCMAFNAEWMFFRVTSVGAAHPCPTRLPEWTERNTTSEIADEPRAIVNGSFRWSVIGRNSIRSIRTPPRTDDVEYQGAPPAPPPESGARGPSDGARTLRASSTCPPWLSWSDVRPRWIGKRVRPDELADVAADAGPTSPTSSGGSTDRIL